MVASVVLNGATSSARVSEATRHRVQEAAARLCYRRNAVALGLSRSRMDTLGIVATIDGHDINLYFLEVLNGILEGAAEREQIATVFSVADWKTEEARLLAYCDGRIDGLVLIAPNFSPSFLETLTHLTPFVALHSNHRFPGLWNLDVDNEAGGYAITHYLIGMGHRRIAHFPGEAELEGAQKRIAGYRRALEEAGLAYDPTLVMPGGFNRNSGERRMAAMLERRDEIPLPTAIFCANDAIAYGCMEVLASAGIRVPQDISITGFDDTMMAHMTKPLLTTVRQPFRQMGHRAVALLLSQIHNDREAGLVEPSGAEISLSTPDDLLEGRTEIFPVELIIRESAGPPPSHPVSPTFASRR